MTQQASKKPSASPTLDCLVSTVLSRLSCEMKFHHLHRNQPNDSSPAESEATAVHQTHVGVLWNEGKLADCCDDTREDAVLQRTTVGSRSFNRLAATNGRLAPRHSGSYWYLYCGIRSRNIVSHHTAAAVTISYNTGTSCRTNGDMQAA